MNSVLIFGLLLALMLTGMPISIALGLTVLSFLFVMTTVPIEAVALKLFTGIESFEIMAIPFFILAGNFLTHGGVARRMIRFATAMVGHWYGGMGLAGVMACALFAAVSGSSPATVVAIGSIILPAMVAQGYPKRFGAGVIATSGALGILIPPSIVMVLYAVATGGSVAIDPEGKRVLSASVAQLFMAGVIPGLILATMLGLTTFYRAYKNNYPRMKKANWLDALTAFRDSIWGLLLIVVVLGGIYTGAFTPTEAAAVSAVYAFVIAVFVYRDLKLADHRDGRQLDHHQYQGRPEDRGRPGRRGPRHRVGRRLRHPQRRRLDRRRAQLDRVGAGAGSRPLFVSRLALRVPAIQIGRVPRHGARDQPAGLDADRGAHLQSGGLSQQRDAANRARRCLNSGRPRMKAGYLVCAAAIATAVIAYAQESKIELKPGPGRELVMGRAPAIEKIHPGQLADFS